MEIEFAKEYLRDLYFEGKTSNKKIHFQPQVVRQYQKTVHVLIEAPNTEYLYNIKSLHYEKKVGKLKGIEAVYVNKEYRLEFISRKECEKTNIITICSLIELSRHYKTEGRRR